MTNHRFLLISAIIFAAGHFILTLFPFALGVNIFILWVLVVFFLDRTHKISFALVFIIIVFFDFWSGGSFGGLTLALLATTLIIFLLKKIILTDNKRSFRTLFWLIGFYYLNLFLNALAYSFNGHLVFPKLSIVGLIEVVLWTAVILIIHRLTSYEKRISRLQL